MSTRPLAERMPEVTSLLDEAANLRQMAARQREAAASVGFGSDRAASYDRQAEETERLVDLIQKAAFATYGPEVEAKHVQYLVEHGHEVWSFGYGDEPDMFTTISEGDLWAFSGVDADPVIVAEWGPFRLDPSTPSDVLDRFGR